MNIGFLFHECPTQLLVGVWWEGLCYKCAHDIYHTTLEILASEDSDAKLCIRYNLSETTIARVREEDVDEDKLTREWGTLA